MTRDGYARRLSVARLRRTKRATLGVRCSDAKMKPGGSKCIAAMAVVQEANEGVVVGTYRGVINRVEAQKVPATKARQARGVRLMALDTDDAVAALTIIPFEPEEEE